MVHQLLDVVSQPVVQALDELVDRGGHRRAETCARIGHPARTISPSARAGRSIRGLRSCVSTTRAAVTGPLKTRSSAATCSRAESTNSCGTGPRTVTSTCMTQVSASAGPAPTGDVHTSSGICTERGRRATAVTSSFRPRCGGAECLPGLVVMVVAIDFSGIAESALARPGLIAVTLLSAWLMSRVVRRAVKFLVRRLRSRPHCPAQPRSSCGWSRSCSSSTSSTSASDRCSPAHD